MDNQKKEPNFWVRGKFEQNNFYKIKLNLKTNLITYIFGLLGGALILLPFGIMIFQSLQVYYYHKSMLIFYFTIIWLLIMIFNGISNYLTVKLAQNYNKDMISLQNINAKYIFYYQMLNIGFGIFSLFLLFIFGFYMLR